MGKANKLSELEKGKITAFKRSGWSNRSIAEELRRSPKVVNNFVRNPQQYGRKKHTGRKPKISPRMQRKIINRSSNSTMSINQTRADLGIKESKTTVWRVVDKNPNIAREKMKSIEINSRSCAKDQAGNTVKTRQKYAKSIEGCCVVPPDLQAYAREHDIQLLTHNDPNPYPLKDVFRSFCGINKDISNQTKSVCCATFSPVWAARYTIWVRRRSLMAAKGYIVQFGSAVNT